MTVGSTSIQNERLKEQRAKYLFLECQHETVLCVCCEIRGLSLPRLIIVPTANEKGNIRTLESL